MSIQAANPHPDAGSPYDAGGMLVQAFIPTARDITVKLSATGKQYQMEMADETGFCGADSAQDSGGLYPLVFYDNGTLSQRHDPYSALHRSLQESDLKFEAGVHYSIYNKMGAHPMTVKV